MDMELLLRDEKRKRFSELECTPSEEAENIIEMRTKDREYYVGLVDKTAAEIERIDSDLKEVPQRAHDKPGPFHAEQRWRSVISFHSEDTV
ncbi:Tigger transposable element-derived protein 1 [Plecturocebus cupreus]